MYKKDDSTMFRILVGNRTHLNDVLKDYKFVKNIFKFLGYDKDKIDNIQIQKYKTDNNSYKEIFKYIKDNV